LFPHYYFFYFNPYPNIFELSAKSQKKANELDRQILYHLKISIYMYIVYGQNIGNWISANMDHLKEPKEGLKIEGERKG